MIWIWDLTCMNSYMSLNREALEIRMRSEWDFEIWFIWIPTCCSIGPCDKGKGKRLKVRVWIHFELSGGLRTINNMTYYSFLQSYTFKQNILGREVSDSLSVVISYDLKKISRKGARSVGIITCCPTIFNTSDIWHVENIPKCTGWTLNHLCQFCHCSFRCLCSKLRTCRAGLKPSR